MSFFIFTYCYACSTTFEGVFIEVRTCFISWLYVTKNEFINKKLMGVFYLGNKNLNVYKV